MRRPDNRKTATTARASFLPVSDVVAVFAAFALALSVVEGLAEDTSPRDPEFDALVADAGGLPPELAADALIRLSTSGRATGALRREMLDEAFARAYAAPAAYRRASTQHVPPDTRQGAQQLAYATSLTRVSLQVRVAQLMASLDPAHARELFEWIDLDVAPGTCDDPLAPAVDEYYAAASLLARQTFAGDRGEGLRFLVLYLWRARLPGEMPAVARAMERFRPDPAEAAYLESVFRRILEAGVTDPRGFSSANIDIVSRITELQAADRQRGLEGWHLMEALREYLVAQLRGPRCADSVTEALVPAAFNGALRLLHADEEVKPMDAAMIRPSRILGPARWDWYWQTPDARHLHDSVLQLAGSDRAPVPESVKQTREWQLVAQRVLEDVERWHGHREATDRDFFFQKSALFDGLVEIVPRGAIRERALRSYLEFLRHSDVERDRRLLWFAFLNHLLELARRDSRSDILDALERSGHPVLSTYARIYNRTPRR
jgi:hypothetical protein